MRLGKGRSAKAPALCFCRHRKGIPRACADYRMGPICADRVSGGGGLEDFPALLWKVISCGLALLVRKNSS
jgi:hypothetical protein